MPQLDLVNIPFIPYYISIVLANSVIYYSWKVLLVIAFGHFAVGVVSRVKELGFFGVYLVVVFLIESRSLLCFGYVLSLEVHV